MWTIYLIDVLQNLGYILFIAIVIASIISLVSGIVDDKDAKPVFKMAFTTVICCAVLLIFIPEKKTMYLMVGAYAVEKIVETPEAQEFGNKLLKIANNKLDELAKETK